MSKYLRLLRISHFYIINIKTKAKKAFPKGWEGKKSRSDDKFYEINLFI